MILFHTVLHPYSHTNNEISRLGLLKIIISYKQLVVYTVYLTGVNAIIPLHSGNSYTSNFANSEDTDEMYHFIRVYTICKGTKFFRQQLGVDKDNATVLSIL